ncbi:MAG: hypothetical protein KUG77_03710 [Nannocystaceae bacterium]|nr:hypothetical protein [Nannocystaceae bacterium]
MSESKESPPRPVEANSWPDKLDANVVSPGPRPRVHGYALCEDLARHYDFGEFLVTALVGAPPTPCWGRAVNMALIALGGVGVEHASVHVATLARRCGADDRSTLQAGLLSLVEEVTAEVTGPPTTQIPPTAPVLEFHRSLPDEVQVIVGVPTSTLRQHALRVLDEAGISSPMQQMVALSLAQLPTLAAEAMAVSRGDVRGYPMQLPKFDYQPATGGEHD